MYGRGAAAIAEQIHSTKEEAQKIVDDFYASFPQVKVWMDESLASLKAKGYTEDFYGRRRRLTDINLPAYEVRPEGNKEEEDLNFNPFFGCENKVVVNPAIAKWEKKIVETIRTSNEWQKAAAEKEGKIWEENDEMSNARYEKLAAEALKDHVLIFANTGRRAQAERQCVNARIQGGASSMTKIAMNKITTDPELASYDFHLCIGVHDELIGQCKEEYAGVCAQRLCEIMKTAVADIVDVPFKCDPAITHAWYEDEMAYALQDKYADMLAESKSEEEALNVLINKYCEFTPEQVQQMLLFK